MINDILIPKESAEIMADTLEIDPEDLPLVIQKYTKWKNMEKLGISVEKWLDLVETDLKETFPGDHFRNKDIRKAGFFGLAHQFYHWHKGTFDTLMMVECWKDWMDWVKDGLKGFEKASSKKHVKNWLVAQLVE